MIDIISAIKGEVVSTDTPEDRIRDLLESLDVAEKSRATYTISLKQFISWLRDSVRYAFQLIISGI